MFPREYKLLTRVSYYKWNPCKALSDTLIMKVFKSLWYLIGFTQCKPD